MGLKHNGLKQRTVVVNSFFLLYVQIPDNPLDKKTLIELGEEDTYSVKKTISQGEVCCSYTYTVPSRRVFCTCIFLGVGVTMFFAAFCNPILN